MRTFLRFFAALVFTLAASAGPTAAENLHSFDARSDRLAGLNKEDLARLEALLARGPVALVEQTEDPEQLSAVNVAVLVHAPASVLEAVVTDPARYPRFMPAFDTSTVVARRDDTIVYDWSINLSALQLAGRNVMTILRAPSARSGNPTRVTIDTLGGDLGGGRYVLRIAPHGDDASLLALSMRLDLRQGSYLMRQLAGQARSVNRSANLALGVSTALHLAHEAERRTGTFAAQQGGPASSALEARRFDGNALLPLLERGDLISFELQGDRLAQLAVLGVIHQKPNKVKAVLRDARAFGAALVPGSTAKVVKKSGKTTTFDWSLDVPMIGLSGRMEMQARGSGASIAATRGALRGGGWQFDTEKIGKRSTLVTGVARFDFAQSSWLLERLVSADADLGHGMSAASELMLLRSLRTLARH